MCNDTYSLSLYGSVKWVQIRIDFQTSHLDGPYVSKFLTLSLCNSRWESFPSSSNRPSLVEVWTQRPPLITKTYVTLKTI